MQMDGRHPNDAVIEIGRSVAARSRHRTPGRELDPASGPADPIPVTLEDLTLALSHRIGLTPDEVEGDANFVMDVFGFDDRIIDNVLEREDRQLFYVLEEEGLISTDREENTLHDGREWRTHYWSFRKDVIKRLAEEQRTDDRRRRVPSDADLYRGLPTDVWGSRRF